MRSSGLGYEIETERQPPRTTHGARVAEPEGTCIDPVKGRQLQRVRVVPQRPIPWAVCCASMLLVLAFGSGVGVGWAARGDGSITYVVANQTDANISCPPTPTAAPSVLDSTPTAAPSTPYVSTATPNSQPSYLSTATPQSSYVSTATPNSQSSYVSTATPTAQPSYGSTAPNQVYFISTGSPYVLPP